MAQSERPSGPVRSVRIDDETWDKAQARAAREGHTMSHVMATFVDLYARDLLDMPVLQQIVSQPRVQ